MSTFFFVVMNRFNPKLAQIQKQKLEKEYRDRLIERKAQLELYLEELKLDEEKLYRSLHNRLLDESQVPETLGKDWISCLLISDMHRLSKESNVCDL